jgi:hypothetical protein
VRSDCRHSNRPKSRSATGQASEFAESQTDEISSVWGGGPSAETTRVENRPLTLGVVLVSEAPQFLDPLCGASCSRLLADSRTSFFIRHTLMKNPPGSTRPQWAERYRSYDMAARRQNGLPGEPTESSTRDFSGISSCPCLQRLTRSLEPLNGMVSHVDITSHNRHQAN